MLYNNPPAYRVSVGIEAIKQLANIPNIVCLKESAPDTRRFTDLYNAVGDKIMLFAGLDDVALEGLILGAKGWVSGLTNAFPKESLGSGASSATTGNGLATIAGSCRFCT
jgi:4-hydroxy-tetrahydrodipicolinate synthase